MLAGLKHQKGMTLMELLVAGFISIIASSAMVILMASTLGIGTRTIMVTKLADEMRTSMQIMTRELRRANYHSTYAACFGNASCTETLPTPIDAYINSVGDADGIGINNTTWSTNDCLWFWYDRSVDKSFGTTAGTHEPVAAFRRAENDNGVGIIQMTTDQAAAPNCGAAWDEASWVGITDPNLVDVTTLEIDNNIETSTDYDTRILDSFLEPGTIDSYLFTFDESIQAVERIGITMTGSLISNATPTWMQGADAPTVVLQDFIRVRNNTIGIAP